MNHIGVKTLLPISHLVRQRVANSVGNKGNIRYKQRSNDKKYI